MNSLRQAAEKIALAIRKLAEEMSWTNVTCLVEDKGDVIFEVNKAISEVGVVVVVAVDRFTRRTNSGQILTGTLTIDVTASENVPVNREQDPYVTAQGVAEAIAQRFHWRTFEGGFISPLRLASLDKSYPGQTITSVALSFAAEYSLC